MTGFSKLAVYRQDMPPSGGYSPLVWSRIPSRRIPFWPFVSLWLASNIFGYFYHNTEKRDYWRYGKRLTTIGFFSLFFVTIERIILFICLFVFFSLRNGNG